MAIATSASPTTSWRPPPSPDGTYPAPPAGHPPIPDQPTSGSGTSLRLRVAHWMENHFGRAYLPIAMAGGALVGGTLGTLTLGPLGGIGGALAGGMLGGVLVFAD